MLDMSQPITMPVIFISIGIIILLVIIGLGVIEYYKKKLGFPREEKTD